MRLTGHFDETEGMVFDVKVTMMIPGPGGVVEDCIAVNDRPLLWWEARKWVEGIMRQFDRAVDAPAPQAGIETHHIKNGFRYATDVNLEYFDISRPWTPALRRMYQGELLRMQAEAAALAPREQQDEIIWPRPDFETPQPDLFTYAPAFDEPT